MVEPVTPSGEPLAQRRRSKRITHTVPLTVSGTDALGQPFKERTSALSINCHGCKYQSRHYVLKNSTVTFEIAHPEPGQPPRRVRAKVMWVQRPRTVQELFQIGAQLEIPGNVWGMAFPPDDWFPYPEEPAPEIPAAAMAPPPPASLATPPPAAATPPAAPPQEPPVARAPAHEEKVTVMPRPLTSEESVAVSKQVSRLVAEAKTQLQKAVQEAAAQAVMAETGSLLRELESQLRSAAKKSVDAVASQHLDEAVNKAVERIEQSRRSAVQAMREQWMREFEQDLQKATQQLSSRLGESGDSLRVSLTQQIDTSLHQATDRLGEVEQRMGALRIEIANAAATAQARLEALHNELNSATDAASTRWRERLQVQTEEGFERLRELEQTVQTLNLQMAETASTQLPQLRSQWRDTLESDMTIAGSQWNGLVESAMHGAAEKLTAQLQQISQKAETQAEQDASVRVSAVKQALGEVTSDAQRALLAARADLQQEMTRVQAGLSELENAASRAAELPARVEGMTRMAAEELERRLQEMVAAHAAGMSRLAAEHASAMAQEVASHTAQMGQQADSVVAGITERVKPVLEWAGQESVARFVAEFEKQVAPQMERAHTTAQELAAAQHKADEAFAAHRERLHRASEEYLRDSEARLKDTLAHIQQEFETTGRTSLTKFLEELDAKSTDATHTTFEALYKSAEWYQKKAQTTMQSSLEKVVEQAISSLRDRAAEVSRMFALELDHYSRSYTEHTQGLLGDAAKEVAAQMQKQLEQASDAKAAQFGDEVHRIAREKLQNFAEATSTTRDEVTAALDAHAEHVRSRWGEHAGKSFTEFQDRVAARMADSLAKAQEDFQASLLPILEGWRADRETQQREWMETMGRTSNESVEEYKQRLSNTSNSWLVASVTTLNQHSQTVMDALSKQAEQRLRETCSQAITGLAETLRRQLLGISADLAQGPLPPPEQK